MKSLPAMSSHRISGIVATLSVKGLSVYIVAIAWLYVILMMAVTEASVIAGILSFLCYGVLPIGILYYLAGSRRRRARRQARSAKPNEAD
jgi:biotin transporter BioY